MIDNTAAHFLLGMITAVISLMLHKNIWPAVWGWVAVELTQYDIFGSNLGLVDTIHDLAMDSLGGGVILLTFKIAF